MAREDELLPPGMVAAMLGVSVSTLRRWRLSGTGPEATRRGPTVVRYRRADVEAWIERGRNDE